MKSRRSSSRCRSLLLLVTTTLPWPPLRLVLALVVVPRAVLVVGPRTVLVLWLDLHGLRAISNKVPMLEDMLTLVLDPDTRARL
jgi:hypothetical protein